jgi:hypothetical protein
MDSALQARILFAQAKTVAMSAQEDIAREALQ